MSGKNTKIESAKQPLAVILMLIISRLVHALLRRLWVEGCSSRGVHCRFRLITSNCRRRLKNT